LHTTGEQYMLEDIDEYIQNQCKINGEV
jgi:hypothetical protein